MTTQALQTMAKTFEACQFKGDTLKGTIADGGAIWSTAQTLFPESKWEAMFAQVTFTDGSAIEFVRDPSSTFTTTYKAVSLGKVSPVETRTDRELAQYLLDEIKDYATTAEGRLLVSFGLSGVWLMVEGDDSGNWDKRETLVLFPYGESVIQYVDHTHAYAWLSTTEQFTYCIDTLSISANDANANRLVNKLEKRLVELLKDGAE